MSKKICVYAICKNENKFVKQGLDNMQEADYIVVLDTGSTDGTYEALKADSRVTKVEQKIINPGRFDVARNESMKLIPDDADILVCTDFDELFNEGGANVVRELWTGEYNRRYYSYAGSHNDIGERTDVFKYDKIHNRDFSGKYPVHEILWPNSEDIKIKAIDSLEQIRLDHYPDKEKERHYYFDLLQLAVEENPDDCHERMLLAREYLLNEDYDKSLEEYLKVLNMPDVDKPEKKLVLLECLGRCADLYKQKQNFDEAIGYCQEFIKEDYTYREPYLIMASMYNEMNMFTLAEACVNQALKYGTRKYTGVERASTGLDLPADILSYSYYKLNNIDDAIKYIKEALKHRPEDVRLLKNYNVFLEEKIHQNDIKIEELSTK